MAIASLVLSLTGFLGLFLIGPLLGVIFGYVARRQVKRSHGLVGGGGLALAGVIVGSIAFVLDAVIVGYLVYAVYLFVTYPP
jgi:hypothetical protein